MDFQLFVVEGRSATKTIKLADGVTVVGRQDDCQLRIKSSQVSRKHCELFEKKGLLLVKDLGSSNGTLVNGKRVVESRVLEPGDELSIGPIKLRVGKVGAPAPAAAKAETAPAKQSSDTAITAPPTVGDIPDVDEFDIELDESAEVTELDVLDTPAPPSPAQEPRAAAPPLAAAQAAPEPESVDDAVADFLLDIKLDEDE